jgi:hypothetical protein
MEDSVDQPEAVIHQDIMEEIKVALEVLQGLEVEAQWGWDR